MDQEPKGSQPTRRSLLAGFGLGMIGVAASAAPGLAAGAVSGSKRSTPRAPAGNLQRGEMADWTGYVGATFELAPGSGSPLKLVAVEPMTSGGPRPASVRRTQRFAAVFEAVGRNPPEGDATYWLSHWSTAPLPLHFSPRAAVSGKSRMVAIFS